MNKQTILFPLLAGVILIQSCLSTAWVSDFPQSSKAFDFNKIAGSTLNPGDKTYNRKKGFEYYLKTNTPDDSMLISSVKAALGTQGFSIRFIDISNGAIIGERERSIVRPGLASENINTEKNDFGSEYNCVAGIYFAKDSDGFEIYINCKLTEDITGGSQSFYSGGHNFIQFSGGRVNSAEKLGEIICDLLKNCSQSYPVSTVEKK